MTTSVIVFSFILMLSTILSAIPALHRNRTKIVASNNTFNLRDFINFWFKYALPIIVISLIIGLRFDVGVDWYAYSQSYELISSSSWQDALNNQFDYEWLFSSLTYFLKTIQLPYYYLFISSTAIILILYYRSFSDKKRILPYGLYSLFTLDTFFKYLNILRQGISFFIDLYIVKFIINKKPIFFIIGVILSSGFHNTGFLILPFYFLAYYRKLFLQTWINLLIYLFSWIFGSLLFGSFLSAFMPFLVGRYSQYAAVIAISDMPSGSGLGLLMIHIIDIIIIITSTQCYSVFRNKGYDIYFNIFFCGAILQNIAGMNLLMARLPYNLVSMRIMVMAFTLFLCFNAKRLNAFSSYQRKCLWILGLFISLCSMAFFLANASSFNYTFVFQH